jgi:D-3-phosphoglycerate dehydrogenase / 2-oxoglutarate reductase
MTKTGEKRVAVIDQGYSDYDREIKQLAQLGYTFDIFDGPDRHDVAGKIAYAQGATGIFVRWTEIDGAFLDAVPSIRYIVRYGVGYDSVDINAATTRGVKVANVQNYGNHSVSDHALALMFACIRALQRGRDDVRRNYTEAPRLPMPQLNTMTLGIIGLGRIGGTLCAKARPLFNRVLACDPYIPADRFTELGAESRELHALLAEADVISIHCNLTDETCNLIDAEAFAAMKRTPVLVNTARGPIIDEDAFLDALNDGTLHSAGIDVFVDEPPLANRDPLLSHPNLIATGHYAWYSEWATVELQRRAAENMITFLKGELPDDCLNP